MGQLFTYIADEVLADHSRHDMCPWCETRTELYRIFIENDDDSCDEACVRCIKTLPLRWLAPKDDERRISQLINQRYPKGTKSQDQRFALTVEAADAYRRTPCLPNFVQGEDWPHCCGDFTEFIGDAGKSGPFAQGPFEAFTWWGDEDDCAVEEGVEGMMDAEDAVSLFRCRHCEKSYWTFQCT